MTLSDKWSIPRGEGSVELVEDSITFQEMEINGKGQATAVGKPVSPSNMGVTLTEKEDGFDLSGITTDKPYYIVYETKVTDRVVTNEGFRFENNASFNEHTSGNGYNVGQHVGLKSAGEVDYKEKTVEWTIRVNRDERPMQDIVIQDTLGDGLTLIADSIDMTIDGKPYTDFELVNKEKNPFTLKNIGDTDKEIIVTYKTKYNANKMPGRKAFNDATISWIPEDESDRVDLTVSADKQLNRHTEDNSWKAGNYDPDTKEITWNIVANYRENEVNNLIVTDQSQQNQQVIPDSVTVTELALNKDGTFYSVGQVDAEVSTDNNEVNVEIGPTNKVYIVSYKTTLEGLTQIEKEYENIATVLDQDEIINELDSKVGIYGDHKYGSKQGVQDGLQVHWAIDVNLAQEKIANLTLEDTISDNQEYLEDTIKVYHATVDRKGNATKGKEVDASVYDLTIEDTSLSIEWKDDVERAFIVEYSTLFFAGHQEKVHNGYTITGDGIEEIEGDTSDSSTVTIRQTSASGGEGTAGYLMIKKLDTTYDQEELPIEGVTFELVDPSNNKVIKTVTTNEDGYADFGRLLFGNYEIHEVNVPEGYVTPDERETVTIDKKYVLGQDDPFDYVYEVENYKPNNDIAIVKKGEENNVLKDAEFTLFTESGKEVETKTTNAKGEITFENVDLGNYYIQETKAPEGYLLDQTKHKIEIDKKQKEPIYLELENEIDKTTILTEIPVEKVWQGEAAERVTLNLLANGEKVESVTLTEDDKWQHTFKDIRVYDDYGEEFNYTIEEVGIEGYESEITGDAEAGFTVTNTRTGVIDIPVEKVWQGSEEEHVTIHLLANSEKVDTIQLSQSDDWTHTFTDLPEFDRQGEPITYTIEEVEVDGYKSEITGDAKAGFTVTNTRTGKTDLTITKQWKDDDNATEIRPDTITVNVLQNDIFMKEVEVTASDNWTVTIADLPKYDDKGVAYTYTITEQDVPGYESNIDDYDVTNTRAEEKSITIEKAWLDEDASDRPEDIQVDLFRFVEGNDKEKVDTYTMTAADDWSLTIDQLPAFDKDGYAYTYEIEEHEVDGYESIVNGFDITNVRTGTTHISGEKIWVDGDDRNKLRPTSIVVHLFANDEQIDTIEVTSATDWTYEVMDLPAYDEQGKEIHYTITEEQVAYYETAIDGFTITNTLIEDDSKEDPKEDPEKEDEIEEDPEDTEEPKQEDETEEEPKEKVDTTIKPYKVETFRIIDTELKEEANKIKAFDIIDDGKDEDEAEQVVEHKDGEGHSLPKTATQIFSFIALGMGLVALGAVFQIMRKRKKI